MKNKFLYSFVFLFLFIISFSFTFAHGDGFSYEEVKDGYKIDIGHKELIAAQESTRFDFDITLENSDAVNSELFTDVWVTFIKDKKVYFAGGVHKPTFGATGFTYVFPEAGTYTVSARYQKEGETIVKTEFPITVGESSEANKNPNPFLLYGLIGCGLLLLGVAVGLFIPRKNNKITV